MRRSLLRFAIACALTAVLASIAFADVQVKIAVSPTTIPQCSQGQLFTALANTGTQPILVKVCFALVRGTTTVFGPVCGHLSLAAGERRAHEFNFIVPRLLPPGDYAFAVAADASDGTSDHAAAPFTVVAGTCPGAAAQPDGSSLLNDALQSTGAQPDSPAPVPQSSWGKIKILYR